MQRKHRKSFDIGFYVLVLAAMVLAYYALYGVNSGTSVTYAEAKQYFVQERVESFQVSGNNLTMTVRDSTVSSGRLNAQCQLYSVELFHEDLGELIDQQYRDGIILDYDLDPPYDPPWWSSLLLYGLLIAALFLFWQFMAARAQGGGMDKGMKFGKARIRFGSEKDKKVTFRDVAGADEEKEELEEIVRFLKEPQKYLELGARIPKGVLLVGPPGTGKTLLAKAVAGEAGVGFLSISGSDFVELYVGVGASRVRDLFAEAKKVAPAVVFIDEIDAVGRQRGAGLGGGHDEREQTLNQLLVEMDGFAANEGVVVLAATNRRDILDPALLRPGRFDRQVYVGYPDIRGREEILDIYVRNKPLAEDVDLRKVAQVTHGFTGADLENLVNEAALNAARADRKFINEQDLESSVIKVIAGPEKRSRVVPEKERRLTAYHEAGHAVVSYALKTQDPVHQITIIPRGQAGGMTINLPQEDTSFYAKTTLTERIAVFLGGRVAEKLFLGDISTGAGNDIQRATALARQMVTAYGMSDRLGSINYQADSEEVFIGRSMGHTRPYSEAVAAQIDEEVKAIIDGAYARCEEILRHYSGKMHQVADYLLQNETMDGETFRQMMEDGAESGAEAPAEQTEPEKAAPAAEAARTPDRNAGGAEHLPEK